MPESKNQPLKSDGFGFFNPESIFSCLSPEYLDEDFCKRLGIDLICCGYPSCACCGPALPDKNERGKDGSITS